MITIKMQEEIYTLLVSTIFLDFSREAEQQRASENPDTDYLRNLLDIYKDLTSDSNKAFSLFTRKNLLCFMQRTIDELKGTKKREDNLNSDE